ncbi:MAG: exo-alpha-sialidase [Lewinellaceae bacterium]|nr:exo-alpha-sialidase [Lewinellaceae bacterium]
MRKIHTLLALIPAFFFSICLAAQGSLSEIQNFDPFPGREINPDDIFPLGLNNGELLMLYRLFPEGSFSTRDTLFSSRSLDGGASWEPPQIAHIIPGDVHFAVQGIKTSSGRLIIGYYLQNASGPAFRLIHSDDNGQSWSAPAPLSANFMGAGLSQTDDGKLWLVFPDENFQNIQYRISEDDGISWSSEQLLISVPNGQEYSYPVVSSGNDGSLLLHYLGPHDNNQYIFINRLYQRNSSDGGASWSAATALSPDTIAVFHPISSIRAHKPVRQEDGTLWIFFEGNQTVFGQNQFGGQSYQFVIGNSDIYYSRSTDEGQSWESPQLFTHYTGNDSGSSPAIAGGQPFLQFTSSRWSPNYLGGSGIWYGIPGLSQDDNPPPTGTPPYFFAYTPTNEDAVLRFRAFDETEVVSVQAYYSINGGPQAGPFSLFDDGLHGDEEAGDGLWGGFLPPLQLGETLTTEFRVTDSDNNSVTLNGNRLEGMTYHNVGNISMAVQPNGTLSTGNSAVNSKAGGHWPRENGEDYLFYGDLWVAADINGEKRFMRSHDWKPSPGSELTIEAELSDQDISMYYDDRLPQGVSNQPIGLSIHQESFQWADGNKDDFIIFRYTIKNKGTNGGLEHVIAGLWMNTQASLQNSSFSNQRGSYDTERNLLYSYNTTGNPDGYVGLKLLGNIDPFTVDDDNHFDLETGEDYYNYMNSSLSVLPFPQSGVDLLFICPPPFSLAAGDSITFSFGYVMGHGLEGLKANTDIMDAVYANLGMVTGLQERTDRENILISNFPNPFRNETRISFELPQASLANISIYDFSGKQVRQLANTAFGPGNHIITWDGKDERGKDMPNGLYFCTLEAEGARYSCKLIKMQ